MLALDPMERTDSVSVFLDFQTAMSDGRHRLTWSFMLDRVGRAMPRWGFVYLHWNIWLHIDDELCKQWPWPWRTMTLPSGDELLEHLRLKQERDRVRARVNGMEICECCAHATADHDLYACRRCDCRKRIGDSAWHMEHLHGR